MKINFKGGFTLIELLVVIAIIGLLSSIVFASLSNARKKSIDTAIKSEMTSARSQAELYYYANGNSYNGVCLTVPVVQGTKITPAAGKLLDAASKLGGGLTGVVTGTGSGSYNVTTCHNTPTGWAAETPLKDSKSGVGSKMWCIDYKGVSRAQAAGANLVKAPSLVRSCLLSEL